MAVLALSDLLGAAVRDHDGAVRGRIRELAIAPQEHLTRVAHLVVRTPDGDRVVSADSLKSCGRTIRTLSLALNWPPHVASDTVLLLKRDLLDQQIIDVHGRKVVRVNDVELEATTSETGVDLHVVGVDVGARGAIRRLARVAAELNVVLPLSVFERAHNAYFNTLVMVDADGSTLGIYRKSHIPESPGYHEKFYFSPGDTGFKVWPTRYGTLGVAVCWDQWFPEAARAMALMGAEILLYPTAIGSEPQDPELDSRRHWQRTMQGHAAANIMPLVASNRIGTERGEKLEITFYGHSFIADHTGEVIAQADDHSEQILTASFDLDEIRRYRHAWGVFRDRRPDLYGPLMKLDGVRD